MFALLGVPNILGYAGVAVLAILVLWLQPHVNRKALLRVVDVLTGFATVFAGLLIAHLLNVGPTAWLPVIAATWFAIHFVRLNKTGAFVRASAGILCGWLLYTTFPG